MDKKPEKLVPEVRFKGFTDDWEQRELGDITNYIKGYAFKSASYQAKGNVLLIRASDLSSGTLAFLPDKKYLPSQFLETFKRYKLNQGDIVITTVGSKSTMKSSAVGRPIYINSNKPYLLNQNLVKITVNDSINSFYLYNQLLKSKYKYFVSTIERGNANQANITIHDLWKYKAFLTSELEEKQIGHLLLKLNQLFYLQQRKLEQLKQLKKAMLQQLFVDKNNKQPNLRFKNFKGNWEQHRLEEVAQVTMGQSPSSKNYTDNPNDYVLVQRNADLKSNKISPRVWTKEVTKQVHKGEIIMTVRAPVGYLAMANMDAVIGRGVAAIDGNKYLLQTKLMDRTWEKLSSGSTFESISSNDIKNLEIKVTETEEEKLIAKLMDTVTYFVTLQKNKLTQLTTLKKYLLQNLFI